MTETAARRPSACLEAAWQIFHRACDAAALQCSTATLTVARSTPRAVSLLGAPPSGAPFPSLASTLSGEVRLRAALQPALRQRGGAVVVRHVGCEEFGGTGLAPPFRAAVRVAIFSAEPAFFFVVLGTVRAGGPQRPAQELLRAPSAPASAGCALRWAGRQSAARCRASAHAP